jgi:hypothetical protein
MKLYDNNIMGKKILDIMNISPKVSFLFVLIVVNVLIISSCQSIHPEMDEDYRYDNGKPCAWYKLSSKKDVRLYSFENIDAIDCRIKADIEYIRLDHPSESSYCRLEACPELLDRVDASVDASGRLVLDYSKCIQDHRLPVIQITIASHFLEEVNFLGNYFYSKDTILSKSGELDLKLKYRGAGFNVFCNVPLIRLENILYGEEFVISGICDSVSVQLYSGNASSQVDLRGLHYRSLYCALHGSPGSSSYAGHPEYIYYAMLNVCVPLFYRGNPIIQHMNDVCETVQPE